VVVVTATPIPPPISTPTPRYTPTPRAGEERDAKGGPIVFVPAGEFTMGSNDGDTDEKPVHTVYLDAFWIDKYEVTNAQYKKCVDDNGKCKPPNPTRSNTRDSYYGNPQFDDYPVIYVSWEDADTFCRWAGNKHLPTEAQWEKAASWDEVKKEKRVYPWGNTFDKNLLNSSEGGKGDTTAVGSYPGGASPYGAMDMAGNVWEWVADWYDDKYYANSPRNNPPGPDPKQARVLRGGSWNYGQDFVRAAYRIGNTPGNRSYGVGFRCAQ
jgi:serine/threonine-protein kinase